MTPAVPVLEMRAVTRQYSGLRPLRIRELVIGAGERVSVGGLDAGAGELLVNLVTGASVPDSGEVRVFGQRTADITDGDAWLELLERFGIVSPRAVLLEGSTLLQNLAMPFSLQIDPVPAEVVAKVEGLMRECGLDAERWLHFIAGELPPEIRVLAHLVRALALAPDFIVIEHPTADVAAPVREPLAAAMARACDRRQVASLVLTNDDVFAKVVAPRNLRLDGATGVLKPLRSGWFR
jgi:predicted ABC-type transport system involved in lysophospholipase L1 biosynthesis ATPase subunit